MQIPDTVENGLSHTHTQTDIISDCDHFNFFDIIFNDRLIRKHYILVMTEKVFYYYCFYYYCFRRLSIYTELCLVDGYNLDTD